jgi:hypothetical protein
MEKNKIKHLAITIKNQWEKIFIVAVIGLFFLISFKVNML